MKKIYLVIITTLLCGCSQNENISNIDYNRTNIVQSDIPYVEKTIEPNKPTNSPDINTNNDGDNPYLLAEFSTTMSDIKKERVNNIRLAAEAINETVVKKGEIFSFNKVVGNRTEEKGYQIATVFVGKEKTEGVGGGVCQVSTSLYGAVKMGGFEVVELHHHEREVGYIKAGEDSTVNYDNLDFKFRNNSDFDIKISTKTTQKKVTVQIWKVE